MYLVIVYTKNILIFFLQTQIKKSVYFSEHLKKCTITYCQHDNMKNIKILNMFLWFWSIDII